LGYNNDTQKWFLQYLFNPNQFTIAELGEVTGIHENYLRLNVNQLVENEKFLLLLSEKK
jgi:hypothetical protein